MCDPPVCILTVDITIADATPITETHTQTPTLCAGGATGTVVFTPAGGTGPYTITPAQTGLTAGLHTFTITDANGCILTVDITISEAHTTNLQPPKHPACCLLLATKNIVFTPA